MLQRKTTDWITNLEKLLKAVTSQIKSTPFIPQKQLNKKYAKWY